ncbi:MAG: ABC transporter permease [Chloroflexi bacterium]|nr:ABC transporter permease [Chloroflexota bacterium]
MSQFVLRRLSLMVPTLFLALTAVFILVRVIPGDAVTLLLDSSQYSKQDADAIREQLGIADSIPVQYGKFMRQAVSGDFGNSIWSGQPVMKTLLTDRLPITFELTFFATLFAVLIGIPAGVVAAVRQDSIWDYVVRTVGIGGLAIPGFWLGTLVIVLPAYWWGWTLPIGFKTFAEDPASNLQQILVPALVMSIALAAVLMRMTRSMMLEVLRQDYVRTARAKGLDGRVVIIRHCLRNAMLPLLSIIGVQVAVLLAGTVIFETVFTLPGVGSYLYEGISRRDYPVVQGVTVMLTVAVVLLNFIVDISYRVVDPRVRV